MGNNGVDSTVTIAGGATLTQTGPGYMGGAAQPSGNTTVTVEGITSDGVRSTWDITLSSGSQNAINLGQAGPGTAKLIIEDGGLVTTPWVVSVGQAATPTQGVPNNKGEIDVTTKGELDCGDLTIGNSGVGILNITDGKVVVQEVTQVGRNPIGINPLRTTDGTINVNSGGVLMTLGARTGFTSLRGLDVGVGASGTVNVNPGDW